MEFPSQTYIQAVRTLYDAGAFLRLAKKDKSLLGKMEGIDWSRRSDGQPIINIDGTITTRRVERVRSTWREIENHIKKGLPILYYNPGEQGLMILDFDPMINEWVESVSDHIGSPPQGSWKSSGKLKPATKNKPAGYGGHAVWKVKKEHAVTQRHFSNVDFGVEIGQIFSGHKGFGVILYDPIALANVMEMDDIEYIVPKHIPLPGNSTSINSSYHSNWTPNLDSRHDSTVSAIGSASRKCKTDEEFANALSHIQEQHSQSISPDERDVKSEWKGLEKMGWRVRLKDKIKYAHTEENKSSKSTSPIKEKRIMQIKSRIIGRHPR